MTSTETLLWSKIDDFQFDEDRVVLTFEKRLARENDFSLSFAKEVVSEYKKFIFLCCVSDQAVTPSHYVDLAWHLHLTYTKSYWIDLCKLTIQKEIHHNPTEGGKKEDEKFKNQYNDTLLLYKKYFGIDAPQKIWEIDKDRFSKQFVSIDKKAYWMIKKPNMSLKNTSAISTLIIASTVFLAGCNPVGGVFIIVIIAALFSFLYRMNSANRSNNPQNNNDASSGCGYYSGDSDSGDNGESGGDSGSDSGCSSGCGGGGCGT